MTMTMILSTKKHFANGKKMDENKPIAPLLYPDINTFSEPYINEKIVANKKFNNNITIIKDIRNYYETETNNSN